ncbi:ADP-ribose pyrophosphatase YjhB, NUDIX family [Desulfacinum hydrothermale DSM 13146]|uniref:ADP-ribose pyrophosphatase YjhB, NUDIX family n=1 Tax=Desulfacinum hydrothermale DSM 13146 TaxID=1121390 RepID=A0A1W1XG15_9BACT|nr:NUDIX domain-containing protein [Desulfacinum hydrothermale]SMC22926.1 ADP-ribose pyrophosphatase YjhB, NUDIX family [Desulfacinum hydrothermale DSM 13146]
MKYCPLCASLLEERILDARPRLACSSPQCDYVFWNNPTPVVAAVVEVEGSIVLVRSKGWPKKFFGVVAGFLEAGETPEQGALREVQEELGLDGRIEDFLGIYSFFEKNQVIFAYHVQAEGQVSVGDELAEVKLLPPEKVRPWDAGTGPAVREFLSRRGLGEAGGGSESRRP